MKEWTTDRGMFYVSFAIALFTLILAVKTCNLVQDSHRQIEISDSLLGATRQMNDSTLSRMDSTLKLTKQISDSTLARTDSSLRYTKLSLESTKKSFEIQNRAYISLVSTTLDTFYTGMPCNVYSAFSNQGNTPLYNYHFYSNAIVDSIEHFYAKMDSFSKQNFFSIAKKNNGGIIGIKEIVQGEISFDTITAFSYNTVKAGKVRGLFCWGYFTYYDSFGHIRFRTFCQRYDFRRRMFVTVAKYEKGN